MRKSKTVCFNCGIETRQSKVKWKPYDVCHKCMKIKPTAEDKKYLDYVKSIKRKRLNTRPNMTKEDG